MASTAVKQRPGSDEAPLVLDLKPPRPLGAFDQSALWGNLGVSLLGFSGAFLVLAPTGYAPMSLGWAFAAVVVGTLIGTAMVAVAAMPGTTTGAPAMALLRGIFGTRLSYLPTALNIIQCLGWAVFELLVIAQGVQSLSHGHVPHWSAIIVAGVVTTALTMRPIGAVRLLRRYVAVAMIVTMVVLTVLLLRHGLPPLGHGSGQGFLPAVDTTAGVAVSWVPLAADYTRHARSARAAVTGTMVGYTVGQVWCYGLGLVAISGLVDGAAANADPTVLFSAFMGLASIGPVLFAVLVIREIDQSFMNVYSTAMSIQNLRPRIDRRVLCAGIGAVATALALLVHDFSTYQNFLYLIGSVFIPMFAVLAVDYFFGRGRNAGWNLSQGARARWIMLLPWVLGFATYQLFNPGTLSWWVTAWTDVREWLHITPQSWTSATILSFLVAFAVTAVVVGVERLRGTASRAAHLPAPRDE